MGEFYHCTRFEGVGTVAGSHQTNRVIKIDATTTCTSDVKVWFENGEPVRTELTNSKMAGSLLVINN